MKKLLAFFLCLSMLLGAVAFATELNKEVMEGQTTVSLTIDPEANEFVIVIPATVEIDPETKKGESEIVLKAGWKLISSNTLTVNLKSAANGVYDKSLTYDDHFTLMNADGVKASYTIAAKTWSGGNFDNLYSGNTSDIYDDANYWKNKKLIEVSKSSPNTEDKVCLIRFTLPKLPTEPGVYTDVLTFAVTLK